MIPFTNGSLLPALKMCIREGQKEIAQKLGKPEFNGARGWLDKWKKRYNVKQLRICGESGGDGDVQGETVKSWKERLPEILQGYI